MCCPQDGGEEEKAVHPDFIGGEQGQEAVHPEFTLALWCASYALISQHLQSLGH